MVTGFLKIEVWLFSSSGLYLWVKPIEHSNTKFKFI